MCCEVGKPTLSILVIPLYHDLLLITLNFGGVFWVWVLGRVFCLYTGYRQRAHFLILLKSLQVFLPVLEIGLYINSSQSEVEDFDTDGKFWSAFRFPAFPKATGTITYRVVEPNYKPHTVGFSLLLDFLPFWRLGEGKWLKTEEVYCWQYILSALRHAWDQSSP